MPFEVGACFPDNCLTTELDSLEIVQSLIFFTLKLMRSRSMAFQLFFCGEGKAMWKFRKSAAVYTTGQAKDSSGSVFVWFPEKILRTENTPILSFLPGGGWFFPVTLARFLQFVPIIT